MFYIGLFASKASGSNHCGALSWSLSVQNIYSHLLIWQCFYMKNASDRLLLKSSYRFVSGGVQADWFRYQNRLKGFICTVMIRRQSQPGTKRRSGNKILRHFWMVPFPFEDSPERFLSSLIRRRDATTPTTSAAQKATCMNLMRQEQLWWMLFVFCPFDLFYHNNFHHVSIFYAWLFCVRTQTITEFFWLMFFFLYYVYLDH